MDTLALALLVLSTAGSLFMLPELHLTMLIEPTVQAAITTPIVLTALIVMRLQGWRPVAERRLLALFLTLMPTVYLLSGALHGISPSWLGVELLGQVVFAAAALAGLWWSPWILVVGIACHGLVWDMSHYGRTTFMPDWYAIGCLIVDVGWAGYAALRVPAWRAEGARDAARAAFVPGRPGPAVVR